MPDSITATQVKKELNDLSPINFLKLKFSHGNAVLNYRLQLPMDKDTNKYPLVITLHNSSRLGTDNESQLEPLARIWLQPYIQKKFPAFILAPQFANRSSNYTQDSIRHFLVSKPSPDVYLLLKLIDEILNKYPQIDHERIYLVGYSMGASTAQNLLNIAPEMFAAVISIAAVPDFSNIDAIRHTPIWLIHGLQDKDNSYEGSEKLYKALSENKNLRFTSYRHLDHNQITIPLLTGSQIPAWLWVHRRELQEGCL